MRKLMIVFPLGRSLLLKVAMASSREAVIPMFVRSRPSTHSLRDLCQLRAIRLDDEVHRPAICRVGLDRADHGHQRSPDLGQGRGPLLDLATDDVEDQVDLTDVLQRVVVEVDELLRPVVEGLLSVGSASGADDVGAGLGCQLGHHRPHCAGGAVGEDALPALEEAVLEQSLPGGQTRDREGRGNREVEVVRQGREVACLHRHVLRQGAVAMPVGEAEHPLSYRQPGRAVAKCSDNASYLVSRDRWCPVTIGAIGPGRWPLELRGDPSRCMNLNDDVVDRSHRLGPLCHRHPGRSRSLVLSPRLPS